MTRCYTQARNVRRDNLDMRRPVWVSAVAAPSAHEAVVGTKYGELRFYDLRASRRPQAEVKGISGDKGGHQECDRGISALCLTREPFPGVCRADVGGDISCVDARTRRMCKRLAGPAGAVWALDVCEFEGEWKDRVAGAGYDRHVMCWNLSSRIQAPLASVYCKQRLMDARWVPALAPTDDDERPVEEDEEDEDEAMAFGEEESDDDDEGEIDWDD